MLQQVLVAAIVFIAACVSVWKLMPARRRWQSLLALDGFAARHRSLERWRHRWLGPRLARAATDGCSGCSANAGTRPPPR